MKNQTYTLDKQGKKWTVTSDDIRRVLTWAFNYKTKYSSTKFIWNIAFKSTMWDSLPDFKRNMKEVAQKSKINSIQQISPLLIDFENNISIINNLNDQQLGTLFVILYQKTLRKKNNRINQQLYVFNEVIKEEILKKEFKKIEFLSETIEVNLNSQNNLGINYDEYGEVEILFQKFKELIQKQFPNIKKLKNSIEKMEFSTSNGVFFSVWKTAILEFSNQKKDKKYDKATLSAFRIIFLEANNILSEVGNA